MSELLPVPLLSDQFIDEFITCVELAKPGDAVGIATMQLAAQVSPDESLLSPIIDAMTDARRRGVNAAIQVDGRYVDRMTRIGNRDYPNYLPLATEAKRAERQMTRRRTNHLLTQLADAGLLIRQQPARHEKGYTPLNRYIASLHLAQTAFSVIHSKAAYVQHAGRVTAWVNTGNLTDSDLRLPAANSDIGMNNIVMRVEAQAAGFVMQAVRRGFGTEAGTYEFGSAVRMVHDIGNNGEPGRLPTILNEALVAIDPRRGSRIHSPLEHTVPTPQSIVLLSQYAPNGLLANALSYAAEHGSRVQIPLEPDHDHRSKNFPYNVNNHIFQLREIGKIAVRRPVPSHIKALLVTYDDETAKVIFGTDNFVTNIQKLVRNEEIATVLSLDLKEQNDRDYYRRLINLLLQLQEIDTETAQSLLN